MICSNYKQRRLEIDRTELVLLRFVLQHGSIESLLDRHGDVLCEDNPNFPGGAEQITKLAEHMHRELCSNGLEA